MWFSTFIPLITIISGLSVLANSSSECKNPEVRKEWRDMSDAQKKEFIRAVKCLGGKPHNSKLAPSGATSGIPPMNKRASYYDDFVYAHMDSNVKDHFTGLFLPWHRWYLHWLEKALKDECGFQGTLPFWDWSRDTKNGIEASPVFNSSKIYGLGTLGSNATNYTVTDGAFGTVFRAYPTPHVVTRQYNAYPFKKQVFPFEFSKPDMPATDSFTPEALQKVVKGSRGNYTDFAYNIDGVRAQGMHNAAHLMMGGDLANPLVSPNDPMFYMHHANLDRIWALWQNYNWQNKNAYGGGLTQNLPEYDTYPVGAPPAANKTCYLPTVGLSDPVQVKDVMDMENGYLCYKYAY
ncbi:hypothetical protein FRC12_009030 [Ceratobasidium sp. 428]|nr:hypothetical protein FRC12_009030 [Ceratobasidium sp. 428]